MSSSRAALARAVMGCLAAWTLAARAEPAAAGPVSIALVAATADAQALCPKVVRVLRGLPRVASVSCVSAAASSGAGLRTWTVTATPAGGVRVGDANGSVELPGDGL